MVKVGVGEVLAPLVVPEAGVALGRVHALVYLVLLARSVEDLVFVVPHRLPLPVILNAGARSNGGVGSGLGLELRVALLVQFDRHRRRPEHIRHLHFTAGGGDNLDPTQLLTTGLQGGNNDVHLGFHWR